MNNAVEIVFWCSLGLYFYIIAGHGLLLAFLNLFLAKPVKRQPITPHVCFIIPAYNEEKDIDRKIRNTLNLDYPGDMLEVIVVSDASSDRTDEIVEKFSMIDGRVHLLRQPHRMGRTAAINDAVRKFERGLYAISDANVILNRQALRKLVMNFADPDVGAATARFIGLREGINPAERGVARYWDYEQWMRTQESSIYTISFLAGSFNIIRGELLPQVPLDVTHDHFMPAFLCRKGARTVYDPHSLVYEYAAKSPWKEAEIRSRNFLMGVNFLRELPGILTIPKHPWFFLNLLFRKILRWLSPLFLLTALVSSLFIIDNPCAIGFMALFGIGLLTMLLTVALRKPPGVISTLGFFMLSLLGLFWGILLYIFGKRIVTWEPPR